MSFPCFPGDSDHEYQKWRDRKLHNMPGSADELVVEVSDPTSLSLAERNALTRAVARTNMAIYAGPATPEAGSEVPRQLGAQFGLHRLDPNLGADEDAMTALRVIEGAGPGSGDYVPYTDKALNWHTDGYYNAPDRKIESMVLHCVRPAAEGGENALLDPDIAYIVLRDANPDWARALCHPNSLTTPANIQNGVTIRPERSTSVFSTASDGSLLMDYTERKRNVIWRDDPDTLAAVAFLREFMASDSPFIYRARLEAGWGLLCNNVLHTRTAFRDNPSAPRLVYRGRYYDRIRT
ncbi:MAG: TauD/TfdA family dioxygenase [Gammaproteobacteria bacterium]|nr:TauD/TfdA family dioxygenase [Gammaproteobacteria bacterium]MCP5137028.1 TauD/TfdA family dioxygenase [Gammaproteobacteria bacterium]